MNFTVSLSPSGRQFAAASDKPILQSAEAAGLILPYGCRNGACGACKSRLLAGEVEHGPSPETTLPASERTMGQILLCCAQPRSDLTIEAREAEALRDMPIKTLPCRVERLERCAPDVMMVALKLPANERLQFRAGQYIQFQLKDGKKRDFSIANAPHDDSLITLHIRLVPDGHFTRHVFEGMKVKEIMRLRGPLGTFYLREDTSRPILLLAGGTGFAPIKALIEDAFHRGITRPMVFYWGARDQAGLYMDELARSWTETHAGFRYIPVLSDVSPGIGWNGRTGLVHRAVLEDIDDLSGYEVYACGAPAMIDAARQDFAERGLPADAFFADSFTYAAEAGA